MVMALLFLAGAGCGSLKVGYAAAAKVLPCAEPGQYEVQFTISETSITGESKVLSTPRLIVMEGKKAEITIGDATSSLKCTALVERDGRKVSAMTRVRIKHGPKRVWLARQTLDVVAAAEGSGER